MENKVDYTFTRADVERIVGQAITDKQWEVMASELEDALDYYFNDEIPRLWGDIDSIIAEDSKHD
jgi:hypothetical protein